MTDYRTILELDLERVARPASFTFDDVTRRRDRKRRNKRMAAGVVGNAVFVAVIWIVTTGGPFDRAATPAVPGGGETGPTEVTEVTPPVSAVGPVPETDYLLDLDTGEMTPLPGAFSGSTDAFSTPQGYAVSPDGSRLAYADWAEKGNYQSNYQIFVKNLADDFAQLVTYPEDVNQALSPAWSPDGSKIAYIGWHDDYATGGEHQGADLRDVFVLDLATNESAQLTFAEPDPAKPDWTPWDAYSPAFTPDGASIVYYTNRWVSRGPLGTSEEETRMVPVAGGKSVRVPVDISQLSPDGTLLIYGCGWTGERGWYVENVGRIDDPSSMCVANADGTAERVLVPHQGDAIIGGDWSPDGTRIAYFAFHSTDVSIVDIATGQITHVAEGYWPTWLDDHTLIIEMDRCYDPATDRRADPC
jgi:dipeptidyl aminopeptidase/acylaminoacyl peptidase